MNKRFITILATLLLLVGVNMQANADNGRRASKAPRASVFTPAPSTAPDWAPKLISNPTFESLTSGVTMLTSNETPMANHLITSPSGATIYGLRAQSGDPEFTGMSWWELTTDGRQELLWSDEALIETVGFVRNGEYWGFYSLELWGTIYVNYTVYDAFTGEILRKGDLDNSDYSQMVLSAVYDEWEDAAYVYTYNADMTGAMLQRIDLETMEFTPLRDDETVLAGRVIAWGYNPKDHNIYGVNLGGEFVKLDKEYAFFEYVGMTGIVPGSYSQSMVYSPLDNKFVWAAILPDQTSCIFMIDPELGSSSSTCRFAYPNQYTVLWTPDQLCDDNAPGLATFKSVTFEGATSQGKGVVTLPSVNYAGDPISGDVNLRISDGRTILYSNLVGAAGSDVEFDLDLSEGSHNLCAVPFFKVDGKTIEGHPVYKEVFVGHDTPATPKNIVLTETSITWDAVGAIGANGGYVDTNDVTYNVYLNGVLQNETPIKETTLAITLPIATLDFYIAEVEAIAAGKTSEKGSSDKCLFGEAFPVPFQITPTADEYELLTTTTNGYGMWSFNPEDAEDPFYHVSHRDYDSDDWVFLPLVKLDDVEHLYEFSFESRVRYSDTPNVLDMAICKTTNPADATIFHTEVISSTEYMTIRKLFSVKEPGEYHLAVRCSSYPYSFYVHLKNFRVDITENLPDCPDMVDYLEAVPAKKGELKATVNFTMPRKSVGGSSLYTKGGELTATVRSSVETVSVKGAPGSRQSVEIATVQGENPIYVVVNNSFGDGEEARTHCYTGIDIPTYTDLAIDASVDNMAAICKWTAPKTGVNGGYLDPAGLVYRIYNNHPLTGEWVEIGEVKGQTSFTYQLPEGARQQMLQLGVTVSNEYGGGEQLTYSTIVVGPPHQLPLVENFEGVVTYEPIVLQQLSEDYTASWTFHNPADVDIAAANNSGYALIGFPSSMSESTGRIALPKFSTLGAEKAELKMRFFIADYTPDADILLCGNSDEEIVLGTVSSKDGSGWVTKTMVFPEEFQNRHWAYIALRAHYDGSIQYLMMDSYTIKDPVAQDVAVVELAGAKSTMVGTPQYYDVKIENNGYETIAVPDVKCELINADGQVVKTLEASDIPMETEFAPAEQLSFQFEFIPTVDFVGNFTLRASFDNADMIADNNSKEMPLLVKLGADPIVTDLEATFEDGGQSVELTWTAPVLTLGLEDFEDMTSFAYGEQLGDFKNIDGDGCSTWIFESWTYPDNGLPKGFQVFDYSQVTVNDPIFEPFSGDKYLMAISPDDMVTAADDWLISPQINGGSAVSFQLAIINQIYSPEYIEVRYSSTTDDISEFKTVERFSKSTLGWELFTTQLPEDAKYFALHYISTNTFGIMIDDLTYSPIGETAQIVGYNIYRDGKKIAEKVTEPRYVDENLEIKDYRYNVTVIVEKDGEEREYAMSNNAYANLLSVEDVTLSGAIYAADGAIVLAGYADQNYAVYTASGLCVATGKAESDNIRIQLDPAIYMVKVGKDIKKVVLK